MRLHKDGEFEKVARAVASWSVGINCNIARLARVRDLIHKDLAEHADNRERPPQPRGLAELSTAVDEFERANLSRNPGDQNDTVSPQATNQETFRANR